MRLCWKDAGRAHQGCVLTIWVQHWHITFRGLADWKINTLPMIFPLIGTDAEVQKDWSLAIMQALQIDPQNSRSPTLSSLSLSIYHHLTEKNYTNESPHSHKYSSSHVLFWVGVDGRWNYDTAAIMESLIVTIELTEAAQTPCRAGGKTAFSFRMRNLVQHILTMRLQCLWAQFGNMVKPYLVSDRQILFVHEQLKEKKWYKSE